jgi:hypothetical protein
MKEIERFLNHLYYAAYCMTAWISFVPNRGKYEENIEQGWIIHGLFFFYIIDILIFLLALGELLSGYNIASISNNYLWFSIVLMVFAIILDWVVFHYFVYRKKKYIKYCEEFEKESRLTKIMWGFTIILLYVVAAILFYLIIRFGHIYVPKPI